MKGGRRRALLLIAVILLVGADQGLKLAVARHFSLGEARVLLPGILGLRYVENTGMAFGLLPGGRGLFLATAVVAVGLLAFMDGRCRRAFLEQRKSALLGLWILGVVLTASGALGNAIDRVLRGRVVDYLEFLFVNFAVFNLADVCIVAGTGAILIALLGL